jgi:hypothetical protein
MKNRQFLAVLIISAGFVSISIAEPNNSEGGANEHNGSGMNAQGPGGQGGENGPRRGPPQAAIDACKGKAAGVQCSFIGRNNQTRSGTCFVPPSGGQGGIPLACRPAPGSMQNGAPGNQNGQGMQGQGGSGNGEHENRE